MEVIRVCGFSITEASMAFSSHTSSRRSDFSGSCKLLLSSCTAGVASVEGGVPISWVSTPLVCFLKLKMKVGKWQYCKMSNTQLCSQSQILFHSHFVKWSLAIVCGTRNSMASIECRILVAHHACHTFAAIYRMVASSHCSKVSARLFVVWTINTMHPTYSHVSTIPKTHTRNGTVTWIGMQTTVDMYVLHCQ